MYVSLHPYALQMRIVLTAERKISASASTRFMAGLCCRCVTERISTLVDVCCTKSLKYNVVNKPKIVTLYRESTVLRGTGSSIIVS